MASMKSVSALILDDNRPMRVLLRGALNGFGLTKIHEANDSASALSLIEKGGVDLVLVDYRIGDETGAEFCRTVRNDTDPDIHFLPLIMVTGYAERAKVTEAVNAGVDEFLVKPVTPKALASRINAVIERRRPFFRTQDYFGPERRRRSDVVYSGPLRREDDAALAI